MFPKERNTMASEEKDRTSSAEGGKPVALKKTETRKEEKKTENTLKKNFKNPFVYVGTIIILVLTIIAFVLIPGVGGGVSTGGENPSFGSWNGNRIEYAADSYFADQVSQINDYLRQQGLDQSQAQLYAYQVWRLAFQNTVIRTALLDSAKKAGMKISEQTIDEEIAKDSRFQEDGKFSLEKYNKTPLATRLSIRNRLREDLLIQNYYGDLLSVAPSTAEIEFVASMAKPQRALQYVSISFADFPTEKALEWARNNESLFRTIGLSKITITSSQKDAEKVLAQVKSNSLSFEHAAKSHSKDSYAEKGGDLGVQPFYLLKGEFKNEKDAETLMSLKQGELSSVFKVGENQWAFFRVNSAAAAPDFSKQSVIDEVKSYVFDREKSIMENWALAKAEEFAADAAKSGFSAAAKKHGLSVKAAGPFILNYGKPSFYFYGQQISLFQEPYRSLDIELTGAEVNENFLTA
ncbi:MAG: SurA N-terminal domain-containing protein, partial [Rectinema sp.]|nr:SurA N-terminal domain-containing protein [Rectinema sp.]